MDTDNPQTQCSECRTALRDSGGVTVQAHKVYMRWTGERGLERALCARCQAKDSGRAGANPYANQHNHADLVNSGHDVLEYIVGVSDWNGDRDEELAVIRASHTARALLKSKHHSTRHLGAIRATLYVNFGPEGRCKPNLLKSFDQPVDFLVTEVLKALWETSTLNDKRTPA